MGKEIVKYSWVETHKELVKFLAKNKDNQKRLIDLLKKAGITGFKDKDIYGDIEFDEIDPFTFFCYIYKYGSQRRLKYLQKIAEETNIRPIPTDDSGIPSADPRKVCLFPFKVERNNNEIFRLWNLFLSVLENSVTNEQFEDVLHIIGTGKTKLTEALFNINPEKYFPIDGPTKPYLKVKLAIDPKFNTYTEYLDILKRIRGKTDKPFYQLSDEAWKWNSNVNYWIFQGNPDLFDFETSSDDHLWKTDNKNELQAGIKVTHNLVSNPITKAQIDNIKELSELNVGNQGTNFAATEEEYSTLLEMAETMKSKKYWLYAPGENAEMWEEFCEHGIMGLGWHELGDLNNYKTKEEIVSKLQELENTTSSKKNDATANYEFKEAISIGDIVIVKKGRNELLGYGVVTSNYFYDHNRNSYQKCRKVDWEKKGNWETGHSLALKTLTNITEYTSDHPKYEYYYERLLGLMDDRMNFPLNTIFYGPPGTGKTYNTILRAAQIIENSNITDYREAQRIFNEHLGDRIEVITFHQNYSYEDFIQGLRPDVDNGTELRFERKDGVFKRIADKAFINLKASEKAPEEIIKTIAFNEALENFKDYVLDSEENVNINETAYIFQVEDDAFRYTGKNWTLKDKGFNGFRMKFSDLKEFYENGVKDRQDIKKLKNISGLAKQHASYFIKVYEKVLTFLTKTTVVQNEVKKPNYIIIIDEINRANISRVFGELITLIEPDKRSYDAIPLKCTLPSGEEFIVPSNLYIIGTMNTADKSIALLDIALRRRFVFEAMYPQYEIEGYEIYDVEILRKINKRIRELKGHDFQIGHSYFMGDNIDLTERMNKKVIPLLLEYFMNDEKEVKGILESAGLEVEKDSWPLIINGLK